MHNAISGKIYASTDYRRFGFIEGNRDIADKRVEGIMESIEKVGWIMNPIVVNERLQIIDGQGRFTALKRLGLPVYYVIHEGAGVKEVIALNVRQKNWTVADYCISYAKQGLKPYIWLVDVAETIGMSMDATANIITRHLTDSVQSKVLTLGTFTCEKEMCDAVKNRREYLHLCKEVMQKFKGYKTRLFLPCLDYCYAYRDTDKSRMWNIIETKFDLIPPLNTGYAILESVSELYNKGLKQNKRIYFDAVYKMEERNNG